MMTVAFGARIPLTGGRYSGMMVPASQTEAEQALKDDLKEHWQSMGVSHGDEMIAERAFKNLAVLSDVDIYPVLERYYRNTPPDDRSPKIFWPAVLHYRNESGSPCQEAALIEFDHGTLQTTMLTGKDAVFHGKIDSLA